jgi:hypothetical protein
MKSANEMAFISIDAAAMTALSNYIKINNLSEVKSNDKSFKSFNFFLELIEKQNGVRKFEMHDIKKFHNLRKNLVQQPNVISIEAVNEYVVLVKVLLAYLYNYRASKSGWEQMVKEYKNNL